MKKIALGLVLVVLIVSAVAVHAAGGEPTLLSLLVAASGGGKVSLDGRTGLVRFYAAGPLAQPNKALIGQPAAAVAASFLHSYGPLFGLSAPLQQLSLVSTTNLDGRSVVRYQQVYQGVPVLGGELVLHVAGGVTTVATGEIAPLKGLDTTPAITTAQARDTAIAALTKPYSLPAEAMAASEPLLAIYYPPLLGPGPDRAFLVWRVEVTSVQAPGMHELVLVDAHSGSVALHFNQGQGARHRAIYDASGTALLPGTLVRSEGQAPSGDAEIDNAYDYSGDVYDFFFSRFGRDSFDNTGSDIIISVRYGSGCPNAFWNGEQAAFCVGMVADDVVGHELSHAVTQYASGLFYYYQSGALNEAFSDIFGELIDLTNGRGNDGPGVRWFVGEDSSLGALRNMADPPALGGPDKVSSPYWACDFGFSDNGGVHSNSGVLNKAAYLITDGSTFNGYAITGLGIDKAAAIFYELSENLLTSASDYLDVYDRLPQACYNLVGSNGITDADCQEVVKVVQATEMDHIPTLCGLEEAPLCPDGLACTDLFYDDLENAGSGNWVSAALLGQDAWYYPQNGHPYSGFDATYATSGTTNFWGYDQPSRGDYVIALTRDIALPADTAAYLRFNHSYQFEVYAGRYCDGGMVEYSLDGGLSWLDAGALFDANGYNGQITTSYDNPLQGRNAFVGTSYGYTSSRLHLSALAGQSVRFRFRLATDTGGEHYGWFVDDIRIYSATAGSSPSSTPTPTNTATETSIATLTETETPAPTATYTATASATSTATATATATAIPAYFSISINNAAIYTNSTEVMLTLTAPVGTVAMQVSNDGGFAGASWESFVPSKVWTITSYGAYTLPRTVYARFRDGAGAVSATYQDDIIFDPVPPSGAVRIVPGDAVVAAEAGRVLLQLSASDEVSGVGAMLISNRADFAGATWQQYQPSLAWTLDASGIVYARYRDNAGNQSPVYSARSVGSVRVFVPVVQR